MGARSTLWEPSAGNADAEMAVNGLGTSQRRFETLVEATAVAGMTARGLVQGCAYLMRRLVSWCIFF